jgi:hypothetical protein
MATTISKNMYNVLEMEDTVENSQENIQDADFKILKLKRVNAKGSNELCVDVEALEKKEVEANEELGSFANTVKPDQVFVPIKKELDVSEFPFLGGKDTKKDRRIKAESLKQKPNTFLVSSSRISELKGELPRHGVLQNKEDIAKTLSFTKPCQFCTKKQEDKDEWGVCYRETCTFAHSLEELQLAPCAFGSNCNRKNGTINRQTGKIDTTQHFRCQFKHPDETNDEFYTRTGRVQPDLPPTSEKTRKPTPRVDTTMPRERASTPVPQVIPEKSSIVKIHVPKVMQQAALEMCISKGMTDFEIILTD